MGEIEKANLARLAVVLLILVISIDVVLATLDNATPQTFNDTGITYNASFAYDADDTTFALINITSGNTTYKNFSIGSHANTEDVKQVDMVFDIYVVNSVDDEWAIEYSDDNGSTYNDLRSLSTGNLARQDLTYSDITENTDDDWSWNEVRDDLLIRFILKINGAIDGLSIYLYKLSAAVTYDITEPTIGISSPPDPFVSRTKNVSFYFTPYDDLSGLENCSLIINDSINMTFDHPENNTAYEFLYNFSNGYYVWNINCTDNSSAFYENTTATRDLTVEINYEPNVTDVNVTPDITLTVASIKNITCNATITDNNNRSDIQTINATFYHNSVDETAGVNASVIYRNDNCINTTTNATAVNITCNFSIWYYALPGGWFCKVFAEDANGDLRSGIGNTTINELYALNMTPDYVDYGVLAAGENSTTDTTIVVENLGNMEIDIALDGYGFADGDGLAMDCDLGSIPVSNERYYLSPGAAYPSMIPLTDDAIQLDEFNLKPRIPPAISSTKSTYWKIWVPKPRKGDCNGFVTFGAVKS